MEEKFCQSCAMPLNNPEEYGTEANGSKNEEYCKYCYADGAFTTDCTMEEMIETCLPFMVESGMKKEEALEMMQAYFPTLKRWKKA